MYAPLDVDEGEEEVDDLLGRELLELVLQDVLQDLEELESVRRVEVQFAEHSGDGVDLGDGQVPAVLDEVLAGALENGLRADSEIEAVVADGGDEIALLDLHPAHLHVLLHRPDG